jgi:Putative auto-transporter adhesin, head GIN domain
MNREWLSLPAANSPDTERMFPTIGREHGTASKPACGETSATGLRIAAPILRSDSMPKSHLFAATALAGIFVAVCAAAQTSVPTAPFDSVELRGGGHVTLRYGTVERVTLLKGSTQYTQMRVEDAHRLVIDTCNSDCPLQYDLDIEIVMPRIASAAIAGGGRIESTPGFPAQNAITAAVKGGGNIDLRSVDAKDATAAVNGGGRIGLRADSQLTAAVNGGGSIRYAGNAQVTTAINGGGSVQPEDGRKNPRG